MMKKKLDDKQLFGRMLIIGVAIIVVCLATIRYANKTVIRYFKNNEIEIIFNSIKTGPLEFARRYSSHIANEHLERIFNNTDLKNRIYTSAEILSGEKGEDLLAKWGQLKKGSCHKEIKRKYELNDSIYPFYINLSIDNCKSYEISKEIDYTLLLTFTAIFTILLVGMFLIAFPVASSINIARNIFTDKSSLKKLETILYKPIYNIVKLALHSRKLEKENAVFEAKSKIASQVSHDVRSPLTALSVAVNECKGLTEEERITIRTQISRITDIANHLLLKNKGKKSKESDRVQNILVSTALGEILTEKRLEYRTNMNITIEGDLENSYGLFVKINPVDLKTIISNAVNNSVEAFKESNGKIIVKLSQLNDFLKIQVVDNGAGMPAEVLAKLGEAGFSHGKEESTKSGHGIGVASAMAKVRNEWGGEMSYSSLEGEGTTMTITLPKQDAPSWFMPRLKINSNMAVVALDDDSGIHSIWRKRINIGERLINLSTPEQLRKWVTDEASRFASVAFLSDHELLGHEETGLDLIESLGLSNAILVTSHYAESEIMNRCSKLGVRLIPKMLAGSVPIEIQSSEVTTQKQSSPYNAVHLDDDRYLRRPWKKAAEKAGVNLLSVANEIELMNEIQKVDKEAQFYIDESLGDDHIPGHQVAKKLADLGFKHLYLATGYEQEKFSDLNFIRGVVGKKPVF